jgi:hypothetical protein
MPRAFMMFQTSGLNTGSVRLDTLITGFCCACALERPAVAIASAAAMAVKLRRDIMDMKTPPRILQAWSVARPYFQKSYTVNRRFPSGDFTLLSLVCK